MARIVLGDCIEVMRALPPASAHLVVTSPPYNAGKSYETHLDLAAYRNFAETWCSCISRVLTDTGAMWLNVGYTKLSPSETLPLAYLYYPLAMAHGLRLVQEVVWHYEGGMAYKRRFAHRTERWMWFVKDPDRYTFNLDAVRDRRLNRTRDPRNHPLGKNPTDYWYFNRVVGGTGAGAEKTAHPCQFPVAMLERIVKACSHPGEVVLDPFGGSGSTALAAQSLGRDAISIEVDPRYHAISQARLSPPHKLPIDAHAEAGDTGPPQPG